MKEMLALQEAVGILEILLKKVPDLPPNAPLRGAVMEVKSHLLLALNGLSAPSPTAASSNTVLEERHLQLIVNNLELDVDLKEFDIQAKKSRHDESCQESKLRAELIEQQIKTEKARTATRERELEYGNSILSFKKEVEEQDKALRERRTEMAILMSNVRDVQRRLTEASDKLPRAEAALKKIETEINEKGKLLSSPLRGHRGRRKEETDAPLTVPIGESVSKESTQS